MELLDMKLILKEGAKLTAFKVDEETAKAVVAKAQEQIEVVLRQKKINPESLNQRITI